MANQRIKVDICNAKNAVKLIRNMQDMCRHYTIVESVNNSTKP